ncbi:MAG TPA: sialidase family protein [Fibrobacteraceae bacterium]|nr:sialidase family protein [Fibrobacteraceae bacterium]
MKRILMCLLAMGVIVNASYNWQSVQIHGGGYVPGIAFHPGESGLAYIRTDIGGSYILDASSKTSWTPLNDMFTDGGDMGSVGIGLDLDDPDYLYLTGGLYLDLSWCGGASFFVSSDRGSSWTKILLNDSTVEGTNSSVLNGSSAICLGGNSTGRGMGPRIAVSDSIIFLGTNQNGLLKSTTRGSSWTTLSQFSDTSGVGGVLFDSSGNLYAAPYAGGLYKSEDNGSSWTQISGLSTIVFQMSFSKTDNTIWLTTNDSNGLDQGTPAGGSVYKLDITSSTLTQITMPEKGSKDYGYTGISVDPSDANHVVVSTSGWWKGTGSSPLDGVNFVAHNAIFMTTDGGANWTDIIGNGSFDTVSAANSASSNPHWISALAIDPFDANHIVFGTGYGIWSTFNASDASPTWTFTDDGIEETAALGLVSSTYGAPLVSAIGDIDGFYHSDLSVAPTKRHQVEAGTDFDISYAGQAPQKMIRIYKETSLGLGAYSTDGGASWTSFTSYPPYVASEWSDTYTNETNYAAISADGSSIVWNMQQYGVYYSTDNGASWTASNTSASLLTTDDAGFRVIADRVATGVFYLYNPSTGILYRSEDSGANWDVMNDTLEYGDSWTYGYFRVFASPDAEGDLWITQGVHIYNCAQYDWCSWPDYDGGGLWVGDKNDSNWVFHSTDGGASLSTISSLTYATYVGFGHGETDTASAVYVKGMDTSGIEGIFRSDDNGSSWTQIDDDDHKYGSVSIVIGDPCIYGRVYLGGSGRGIIYGDASSSVSNTSCSDRTDYGIVAVQPATAPTVDLNFYRQGTRLYSNASIRLFDLSGREVGSVGGNSGNQVVLSLNGLHAGLYVASSGAKTMTVNIQ